MDWEDWTNIETWYMTFDSEGNIENDSVMTECHFKEGDDTQMGCSFMVGLVPNHTDYGLTNAVQHKAGWVNGAGDYGVRSMSAKWVW
jgi:hypothetical protein